MSQLVTGDAVVLEMRVARLASRAVALTLDLTVQIVLFVAGALAFELVGSGLDDALLAALALVWTVLVIVGYPVIFETLTRGRSLGKMALGLRVVRDDAGPIRFRHALVRGLAGVVDFYLTSGFGAIITSLVNSRGKRLGDLLAGTVVVRERMPAQGGPVAQMPPQLAAWAGSLDVSRVPDDLALAVRQFLARAGQLEPRVRDDMAQRLVTAVAGATGAWPPSGLHPGAYLSAVLAERRRRELARMQPPGAPPGFPPAYGPPATYGYPPQPAPPAPGAPAPTPPPADGFAAPS